MRNARISVSAAERAFRRMAKGQQRLRHSVSAEREHTAELPDFRAVALFGGRRFRPQLGNQAFQALLMQGLPWHVAPGGDEREELQLLGAPVHPDAGTIVCQGGDYVVDLGAWHGAPCGIEGCVRKHEESHAQDWRRRWPNGCKNPDGTPKAGKDIPTGGPGYDAFLKKSECDAYTTEIACQEANLSTASADCKGTIQDHLKADREQQKHYCAGGC